MARLNVLGCDPSLRNWGIAAGQYDTDTGELTIKVLRVTRADIPAGRQVRQNSKDLACAKQLYEGCAPFLPAVNVTFVEVPHGSQSARAMASYGVCVGVLGSLRANGNTFIELTANEVKLKTVGKKTATKEEMIAWAMQRFPGAPWPYHGGKVNAGMAEHMADACAAIVAGIATDEFKQLVAVLRHTQGN